MKTLFNIAATLSLLASAHIAIAQSAAPSAAPNPTVVKTASAVFAGGCFWCMEADFEKLPGVLGAESGYTGGTTANPGYHEVSAGGTGHTEAVRVVYDPSKVSYPALVDYFWHHIDPTVKDRQFCDVGNQYRSAIFYNDAAQKAIIDASKDAILKAGLVKQILTQVAPASTFYPAEEYHQDYYKKNPIRYNFYRHNCGRDQRVEEVWGKAH